MPTLHIEHDKKAFNKFKRYYFLAWVIILFSVVALVCIIAAVSQLDDVILKYFNFRLDYYISSKLKFLIILSSIVGFVILIEKVFSYATRYFKRGVLREELGAFCEIEQFNDVVEKISPDVPACSGDKLLQCIADGSVINHLGVGGKNWSEGEINDDVIGHYLGTRFRFLDVALYKYKNEKNKS